MGTYVDCFQNLVNKSSGVDQVMNESDRDHGVGQAMGE
jgi:hypothetical protein